MADDEVVGDGIQLIGGDSGGNRRTDGLDGSCGYRSGCANTFDFLSGIDVVSDMFPRRLLAHILGPDDRVGDRSWGANDSWD
jgi:hypothetical protein